MTEARNSGIIARERAELKLGIALLPDKVFSGDLVSLFSSLSQFVRTSETLQFSGIWVTDTVARTFPSLDPLTLLANISGVTSRLELGTGVLQLPLRSPEELSHRVQSLQALSGGRLRLGVGAGSTPADFNFVGADFAGRHKTVRSYLERMSELWSNGRSARVGPIAWPGTENGPPVLFGAWRSKAQIEYAARKCDGWISSGMFSTIGDLETGLQVFRNHGGGRAVLTNVAIDLDVISSQAGSFEENGPVSLRGSFRAARDRLKRLEQMGVDDVLLAVTSTERSYLERVRMLLP